MTGFFHFYSVVVEFIEDSTDLVSMPYDGLFSFLPRKYTDKGATTAWCQCPMTGFFHFYVNYGNGKDIDL